MAGAAAFDDAFLQSSAKVTDQIQTVDLIHEVTAAVKKLESELALIRLSIAASSAALHAVNDKVNELRQRVEDVEARLS
jgi:phage shock protein A